MHGILGTHVEMCTDLKLPPGKLTRLQQGVSTEC